MKNAIYDRRRMIMPLIILWAAALIIYSAMCAAEPVFLASPKIFSFTDWIVHSQDGILYKIFWMIGDWTDCQGFRSLLGGAALVGAGLIVWLLLRRGCNVKMYPLAPVMPQIILGGFTGVGLAVILFGSKLAYGWIPTFLPCCAIPAALVLTYGTHWTVWLTGGVIACLIQYPLSVAANNLAGVLSLPPICLFTILAVGIGGIVIVEIYRILPWCSKAAKDQSARVEAKPYKAFNPPAADSSAAWYLRRCAADFTEILFFGNEWVSLCYVGAMVISWILNPASVCYGVPELFPAMLCGMLLGTSLAVFLWSGKFRQSGVYNTYCVNEVMAVVTLFFGLAGVSEAMTPAFLIVLAVLSAVICPPVCVFLSGQFSKVTFRRYEGVCANIIAASPALGISIIIMTIIAKLLLATGLF